MRSWLQATAIRVIRTGAQAALGVIGAAALLEEIEWDVVGGATALAMLVSFLMALAGLPETPDPSPVQRLTNEETPDVQ
jgi:hypothetical protein